MVEMENINKNKIVSFDLYKCILCPFTAKTNRDLTQHLKTHSNNNRLNNETMLVDNLESGNDNPLADHPEEKHDVKDVIEETDKMSVFVDEFSANESDDIKLSLSDLFEKPVDSRLGSIVFTSSSESTPLSKDDENLDGKSLKIIGCRKIFKCKLCCREFPNVQSIRRHAQTHEKPFKCDLCGFASKKRLNISKHFLSVHRDRASSKNPTAIVLTSDQIRKFQSDITTIGNSNGKSSNDFTVMSKESDRVASTANQFSNSTIHSDNNNVFIATTSLSELRDTVTMSADQSAPLAEQSTLNTMFLNPNQLLTSSLNRNLTFSILTNDKLSTASLHQEGSLSSSLSYALASSFSSSAALSSSSSPALVSSLSPSSSAVLSSSSSSSSALPSSLSTSLPLSSSSNSKEPNDLNRLKTSICVSKKIAKKSKSDGFECEFCYHSSKTRKELKAHVTSAHVNVVFKCQFCDHITRHRYGIIGHVKIVHPEQSTSIIKANLCQWSGSEV